MITLVLSELNMDTTGLQWTHLDTLYPQISSLLTNQQSQFSMHQLASVLSPFHRLVDSTFQADEIQPKARQLIFSQLKLLRKEKYSDFKRYVATKTTSIYSQNEWVSDMWEICCYGRQLDFDNFQEEFKNKFTTFDLKTLSFYQGVIKKNFNAHQTTVTTALLEFESYHWVKQFELPIDFFGEGSTISFRPIYEMEMMKGYHQKQCKKSTISKRFLPVKSSYQPHQCYSSLFAPKKKIKLNENQQQFESPTSKTTKKEEIFNSVESSSTKKHQDLMMENSESKFKKVENKVECEDIFKAQKEPEPGKQLQLEESLKRDKQIQKGQKIKELQKAIELLRNVDNE